MIKSPHNTMLKTKVKEGGFLDWGYMVQLLENEKPFGSQEKKLVIT